MKPLKLIISLIYLLTPRNQLLLEKLLVCQLVIEFLEYYGTQT